MIKAEVLRDQDEVIELLTDKQQVIAMFQGSSEWGPRALGNRQYYLTLLIQMQNKLLIQLRRENITDHLLVRYLKNMHMNILRCCS